MRPSHEFRKKTKRELSLPITSPYRLLLIGPAEQSPFPFSSHKQSEVVEFPITHINDALNHRPIFKHLDGLNDARGAGLCLLDLLKASNSIIDRAQLIGPLECEPGGENARKPSAATLAFCDADLEVKVPQFIPVFLQLVFTSHIVVDPMFL